MPGCCVDRKYYERTGRGAKGCDDASCMTLPAGATCGSCAHAYRCSQMGFSDSAADTTCSFFPRRYRVATPDPTRPPAEETR